MYLSIHPTFGTWVAFRAVVVLDIPGSQLGPGPALLPPLLTDEEKAAAKVAFAEALKASSEVDMSVEVGMPLDIAQKWAAMRDCVALGREYKYDDSQSEYHYTKNPELLVAALAALDTES
jgi:methylmalonic aciduria homocystinuria type C protein